MDDTVTIRFGADTSEFDNLAAKVGQTVQSLSQSQDQAASQTDKAWNTAMNSVERSFATSTSGMIMGTTTLQKAETRVAESILSSFISMAEKRLVTWIGNELALTEATAAGESERAAARAGGAAAGGAAEAAAGAKSVMGAAYKAAASTYASVAEIPIIGPELAPVAAAGAFAAVMAFNVFSAEGGWGQVPFDGALTMLHQNEMVLPASIAGPLRTMTQQGAAQGGGGAGNFNITIQALDTQSGAQFLMNNMKTIAQGLTREARNANPNAMRRA